MTNASQSVHEACVAFLDWLDGQVTAAGRGDGLHYSREDPSRRFWLGRLAPEETVQATGMGQRGERLDPCAVGLRLVPEASLPWTLRATVSLVAWIKNEDIEADEDQQWIRLPAVVRDVDCHLDMGQQEAAFGQEALSNVLAEAGAPGLSAEVRLEMEVHTDQTELVVTLVNTSPDVAHSDLACTHLFEATLEVRRIATRPFVLERLPDGYRYDRAVPALGINAGVREIDGLLSTTDTVPVDKGRPDYWNSDAPRPDLSFDTLADDPIPQLELLVDALTDWNQKHWGDELQARAAVEYWDAPTRDQAQKDRAEVIAEQTRLRAGLDLLSSPENHVLLRAFKAMNASMSHATRGKYPGWRAFQVGFLLGSLRFLVEPEGETEIVDTVWFATGGGKTETYLGLVVMTAFYDRLTGKSTGVTAWSRFPLRMLSLQQTQRFADALAGAELEKRSQKIAGAPFSLGFFVGQAGTPNRLKLEPKENEPSVFDENMPKHYQVLLECPFCFSSEIEMGFDRATWRLVHECKNADCPWPNSALPFYVVDEEIYRFLPTVVIGTLDKAASISMQAAMRGLVGPPLGLCTGAGHGYTYAPRSEKPKGCLVPGCTNVTRDLPQPKDLFAPRLRLQDELHLLRDSLGAVDAHYESVLDHLQGELSTTRAKVVASSATLQGYDRQVDVLYQRAGRVFPQPGPSASASFWTRQTPSLLRRYIAIAPRGLTLEFVNDRTVSVVQSSIRRLVDPETREAVLEEAGIEPRHTDDLISLYGTTVVYGSTLYDVEASLRSLDSNVDVAPLRSAMLTGGTDFDEVRQILHELENPQDDFNGRLHVIAASSMLSHGVDIARLNVMVMLGLPLTTAEFIQTTARTGRTYPGLVYVLHKIARERDAGTFRQFSTFVSQGDRFVEPIPITRRSRRILGLTMPGIVEARRLHLLEPRSPGQRLTTIAKLREYLTMVDYQTTGEAALIGDLLGFEDDLDVLLETDLEQWLRTWDANLKDHAFTGKYPNELSPTGGVMISLRDVEESAPIHD
jgi:hypothetical protein